MSNKTAPGPVAGNAGTLVRTVSAADAPPLVDGNCNPATACITTGWRRVKVWLRFPDGASPTATVQVLHRMTSVAGNGWVPGPTWGGLVDGEAMDLEVFGRDVFFAVTAITGAPTSVMVFSAGWEPARQAAGPAR